MRHLSSAACGLAALFVTLAAFVLPGCGKGAAAAGGPPGGPPPALIRVKPAEQRQVEPKVVVVGSITPRHTSIVASGSDGQVEEFHVEEGQFVKKGTPLSVLRMKSTDLEILQAKSLLREREHELAEMETGSREEDKLEAKARMLVAKAAVENTAAKFERVDALFKRNAINKEEFDEAREKAEAAKQLLAAAEATWKRIEKGSRDEQIEQSRARAQAQKEHVEWLEAEKEKRTTLAPFDGFVVKEQTYLGQWLSKGDPVVMLAQMDDVDVVVNVDQGDLSSVQLGEKAAVRVLGCQQVDWTGEIVSIVPRSDWQAGSRGFPVKVRIRNKPDDFSKSPPLLKEGMMAEVTFKGPGVDAVMVSKDALVRTSRGILVYAFVPDEKNPKAGSVRMIPVMTGVSDGNDIQVMGEGLAAGVPMVVSGAERLRPFQNVQIAEEGGGTRDKGQGTAEGQGTREEGRGKAEGGGAKEEGSGSKP